jgi:predicted GIY-YIG superfamily endonuclease
MSKYYIYTIFNSLNGKIYVGKTKSPQKRFEKHLNVASGGRTTEKFVIHKAIEKYGRDNFEFTIIQEFNNEEDCSNSERYWIKFFNSNIKEFGYNLTEGGEGCSGRIISEATRAKISAKHKGMKHTEETLNKMSGENNHGSKLKLAQVLEIRAIQHNYTFVELAKIYNMSPRAMSRVIYNVDWYDENYSPPPFRKKSKNRKK